LSERPVRKLAAVTPVLLAVCALAASGCAGEPTSSGAQFQPRTSGVLTVATAFLPAPGFWQGRGWRSGFEAALAAALARELGLDRVRVVQVPFATLTAGNLGRADLALSQLTPTASRERSLDFSTAYLTAPPGVLAAAGTNADDLSDLRALRWVVSSTSTLTPILDDRVRPEHDPVVVEDRSQALAVLRAGRARALLLDLPVALGLAHAEPGRFSVPGQLPGDEELAAALPQGSPNREVVDSALRRLQADGTIDRLVVRWLGRSEDDVPLIRSEG